MVWHDLSISHPAATAHKADMDAYKNTLEMAVQLGYTTVAADYTVTGQSVPTTPVKFRRAENIPDTIKQLTRLTLVMDEMQHNHGMISTNPNSTAYDLLAVRPGTEKIFQTACSSFDVDIISLDLSSRLPFFLKHTTVGMAIERGIFFEITYGAAIRDQTARRNLISNATSLIRVTRGRNIIVSSQAIRAMDLRGPYDVINLCTIFGLSQEMGHDALAMNPRAVLVHAETRRNTQKGAISATSVSALKPTDTWKTGS